MTTLPFAHDGFINTDLFQFLVIVCTGFFLLPAIVLVFLMDWNLLDAFQDAFYCGWWWFFSLLFWIGYFWCVNSQQVTAWWHEKIE
jgi:hypothetical protein